MRLPLAARSRHDGPSARRATAGGNPRSRAVLQRPPWHSVERHEAAVQRAHSQPRRQALIRPSMWAFKR